MVMPIPAVLRCRPAELSHKKETNIMAKALFFEDCGCHTGNDRCLPPTTLYREGLFSHEMCNLLRM